MTADPQPTLPDPRTDDEDLSDATNQGQSTSAPAEGRDDAPGETGGSPAG